MSHSNNGTGREGKQDTEVTVKAQRRHYTAEYKQRILDEIDAAQQPGQIGAILRREGLYYQIIGKWRHQRQSGHLTEQKRGPKADPQAKELERLKKENERLRKQLERAESIIEVQKKVSRMLGWMTDETNAEDDPS